MADCEKLALLGGEKAVNRPLSPRRLLGEEEKGAVNRLFDQAIAAGSAIGYNGPEEEAFCKEFSSMLGGGYADGVNSGTNAVHVALKSLELPPYTEVIVGAITDPGGAMPIPLQNLIPVFADAEPGRYNTSAEEIEKVITPLTSAILVPHIGGEPVHMAEVMALADRYGLPVVEDCSQSHGATLGGRSVGTFGQVNAFSTMFGKHMCTGGQGGVVYTRDEAQYFRVRRAADRGKPFGLPAGATNELASLNHNMDELGAAIGREQLKKLPAIVAGRRRVAARLAEGFVKLPSVWVPPLVPGAEGSYWFWRLGVDEDAVTCTKSEYCDALEAEGVPILKSYKAALPQHMDWFVNRRAFGKSGLPWSSPDYKGTMDVPFPTPNAIATMEKQYNLMLHESWSDEDVALVLAAYEKVDRHFRKG